jgi:hypothetical protein
MIGICDLISPFENSHQTSIDKTDADFWLVVPSIAAEAICYFVHTSVDMRAVARPQSANRSRYAGVLRPGIIEAPLQRMFATSHPGAPEEFLYD